MAVLKAGGPWGPFANDGPVVSTGREHDHGRNFDDRCRSRSGASFRPKWLARRPSGRGTGNPHRRAEGVANAKAEIEQTRQKADALSRQVAGQSAANDKLQAELDNLRAGINAYWQQVVRNLCS